MTERSWIERNFPAILASILAIFLIVVVIRVFIFDPPTWSVKVSKYGTCYEVYHGEILGPVDQVNCRGMVTSD